ncbi:predicted protein [Uncinocarpus reesii 1704]|uniref:Uncharacterized protein n=1 Tax=Uncinocarpus reesii (strain UAMH 1704) TaxID=336963 RepID=C4JZP7_UNCRE|nr:uncharacterized protein UREG_07648 [Uncinocarpus reesii 1704]EEP82783.1 predicted protein [Uncinocarpus reesii 1704]
MAARRNPAQEASSPAQPAPAQQQPQFRQAREVIQLQDLPGYPQQVLTKLIAYAVAVVVLPISAYFYSVNNLFDGDTTYAGAMAAITANLVLFSYIVLALREDKGDRQKLQQAEEEKKKK